jgi:hypothetical protein
VSRGPAYTARCLHTMRGKYRDGSALYELATCRRLIQGLRSNHLTAHRLQQANSVVNLHVSYLYDMSCWMISTEHFGDVEAECVVSVAVANLIYGSSLTVCGTSSQEWTVAFDNLVAAVHKLFVICRNARDASLPLSLDEPTLVLLLLLASPFILLLLRERNVF